MLQRTLVANGTKRHFVAAQQTVAIGGKADIGKRLESRRKSPVAVNVTSSVFLLTGQPTLSLRVGRPCQLAPHQGPAHVRRFERERSRYVGTSKSATAAHSEAWNNRSAQRRAIDCIVRNISNTGAALDVASPVGIPRDFTLIVEPNIRSACHIARYKGNSIGVRFNIDRNAPRLTCI